MSKKLLHIYALRLAVKCAWISGLAMSCNLQCSQLVFCRLRVRLNITTFLPFVEGSSKLLGSSKIPQDFLNDIPLINKSRKEFLYVDAVGYIRDYKSGPFHEHSPPSWNITGVRAGWPKINNGVLKMYKGEVLGKLPVVQHLLFGELFKFPELRTRKRQPPVLGGAGGPVSNVNLDSEDTDEY